MSRNNLIERFSHLHGGVWLFLSLLFLSSTLRLFNLNYNTLFLDEAIYTTVGTEALNNIFDQDATSWMFGSYLFPVTSAIADSIAGVMGIRLLGALMNIGALICIFLGVRRLFGMSVALWAAFLFGFSGPSISLAQQSVYDGMGVFFLAMSLCVGIYAATEKRVVTRQRLWVATGILFTLAVLGKYIALFYAPALFGTLFAIRLRKYGSVIHFIRDMEWVYALSPFILIFGTYGATYFSDLLLVFSGQYANQVVDRSLIFRSVLEEIGLVSGLALVGMLIFAVRTYRQYQFRTWLGRGTFVLILSIVFASFWSLPAYHFLTGNFRALPKHQVFALVFLVPMAAYGLYQLAYLAGGYRQRMGSALRKAIRPLALLLIVFCMWVFLQLSAEQNAEFQYSWPNVSGVMHYLEQADITENTRILGSAAAIYEYYLRMPPALTREIWTNIWYVRFFGLEGTNAIEVAIETCQFDIVITDNYYAPDIDAVIEQILRNNANYEVVYSDTQTLRIDAIITTSIYALAEDNQCDASEEGDESIQTTELRSIFPKMSV